MTIKLKSACREPDLSLSGLDPVPLSKIGTHFVRHLLASLGSKGKVRTSLAAGSHFAIAYCSASPFPVYLHLIPVYLDVEICRLLAALIHRAISSR